jgi:hypothetical protein
VKPECVGQQLAIGFYCENLRGCYIIKPQECIGQLVATSATEISLKLLFWVPKKSSQLQTALLCALKVVSLFFKISLFFVSLLQDIQ